jgi:predicted dehydrogenase
LTEQVTPKSYAWADPAYALIHSSIVDCHRNLLGSLRGEGQAETTGADNLRTLQLIDASYQSAASGQVVSIPDVPANNIVDPA